MKFVLYIFLMAFPLTVSGHQDETSNISSVIESEILKRLVEGRGVVNVVDEIEIFSPELTQRFDYATYYFSEREVSIFDQGVVYYQHEYMDEYKGCCVNPGAAILFQLKLHESLTSLNDFADNNHCTIKRAEEIYIPEFIKGTVIENGTSISDLIEVSCKERDRQRFE